MHRNVRIATYFGQFALPEGSDFNRTCCFEFARMSYLYVILLSVTVDNNGMRCNVVVMTDKEDTLRSTENNGHNHEPDEL